LPTSRNSDSGHHFQGRKVKGQLAEAWRILWRSPAQLVINTTCYWTDSNQTKAYDSDLAAVPVDRCGNVDIKQAVGERPLQYALPLWPWPLTFWLWKWCPSHVWRGLSLCLF